MVLSFAEIKDAVSKLAFADPRALQTAGLQKLGSLYDAYPIRMSSQNIFILIKRGLTPRRVGALTELETVANVLVLENKKGRWRRAWPMTETSIPQGG